MTQYTAFGFYTDTGLTIVAIVEGHHSDVSADGDYIEDTDDWNVSRETTDGESRNT